MPTGHEDVLAALSVKWEKEQERGREGRERKGIELSIYQQGRKDAWP